MNTMDEEHIINAESQGNVHSLSPPIVSFVSGKGGVGKSSLALSLAYEMSQYARILFVDLDYFNSGATGLLMESIDLPSEIQGTSMVKFITDHEAVRENPPYAFPLQSNSRFFFSPSPDYDGELWQRLGTLDILQVRDRLTAGISSLSMAIHAEVVVIDAHGGPDVLSLVAASVSNRTVVVTEPDKITIHGTLNFLLALNEFAKRYSFHGSIDLLFNRISRAFDYQTVESVFRIICDGFTKTEPISANLNQESPIAAFPFDANIFEHYGKSPFVSELLPESLFAKKIEALATDLFHNMRESVNLGEHQRAPQNKPDDVRTKLRRVLWKDPDSITRQWRYTFFLAFVWMLSIIFAYTTNQYNLLTWVLYVYPLIIAPASIALVNTARLLIDLDRTFRRSKLLASKQDAESRRRVLKIEWLILLATLFIMVLAWFVTPILIKARTTGATAHTKALRSSAMKQLGIALKMAANETHGEQMAKMSSAPGFFTVDTSKLFPEFLADPSPYFCHVLETDKDSGTPPRFDYSPGNACLIYFGFFFSSYGEVSTFLDEYEKRALVAIENKQLKKIGDVWVFADDSWLTQELTVPKGMGNFGGDTIRPLSEGRRDLMTDIREPQKPSYLESNIPIMWERPEAPGIGLNVLFEDGHVEFDKDGEFPWTKLEEVEGNIAVALRSKGYQP
jgi:cellulose biosynthesis protein BcsQ